mmetsp:Transcript_41925/g.91459  ORF Transcript_41925/g.91459 Transcript_41925/m.91459 type:complete len:214 (+) Transcript_41925:19-660(+)
MRLSGILILSIAHNASSELIRRHGQQPCIGVDLDQVRLAGLTLRRCHVLQRSGLRPKKDGRPLPDRDLPCARDIVPDVQLTVARHPSPEGLSPTVGKVQGHHLVDAGGRGLGKGVHEVHGKLGRVILIAWSRSHEHLAQVAVADRFSGRTFTYGLEHVLHGLRVHDDRRHGHRHIAWWHRGDTELCLRLRKPSLVRLGHVHPVILGKELALIA